MREWQEAAVSASSIEASIRIARAWSLVMLTVLDRRVELYHLKNEGDEIRVGGKLNEVDAPESNNRFCRWLYLPHTTIGR